MVKHARAHGVFLILHQVLACATRHSSARRAVSSLSQNAVDSLPPSFGHRLCWTDPSMTVLPIDIQTWVAHSLAQMSIRERGHAARDDESRGGCVTAHGRRREFSGGAGITM